MNRKKIVSAMLIVTLTCGLGLTACGGAQGSVSGTEEAEVQRYAWPLGSSSPEDTVTQIYRVTGKDKLHVHAVASSAEEMEEFLHNVIDPLPGVISCSCNIILSRVKDIKGLRL